MLNQETLFDLTPEENKEKIQLTEIEFLQLAFSDNKKKKFIKMMEKLMKPDEVYPEFLYKLVKELYENNKTQT